MRLLTGQLTNVEYFDTSRNGNNRYTANIGGVRVFTGVDSWLGGAVRNYEGKSVTVQARIIRGKLTIEEIEEHDIMEINITQFFTDATPMDYSASVAEIGGNAGADTWRAACDDAPDYDLLNTPEKLDAMRKWARSSGGWDAEEIAAWSDVELNALFIQLISGDIREYQASDQVSGALFKGIDGGIYYVLEG